MNKPINLVLRFCAAMFAVLSFSACREELNEEQVLLAMERDMHVATKLMGKRWDIQFNIENSVDWYLLNEGVDSLTRKLQIQTDSLYELLTRQHKQLQEGEAVAGNFWQTEAGKRTQEAYSAFTAAMDSCLQDTLLSFSQAERDSLRRLMPIFRAEDTYQKGDRHQFDILRLRVLLTKWKHDALCSVWVLLESLSNPMPSFSAPFYYEIVLGNPVPARMRLGEKCRLRMAVLQFSPPRRSQKKWRFLVNGEPIAHENGVGRWQKVATKVGRQKYYVKVFVPNSFTGEALDWVGDHYFDVWQR